MLLLRGTLEGSEHCSAAKKIGKYQNTAKNKMPNAATLQWGTL